MKSRTLNIAVAGIGAAGTLLAHELAAGALPYARLSAVCDPSPRLQHVAARFGSNVAAMADYEALLRSGLCDAVVIATPHRLHVEQSIRAMEAGLDVLCEKPAGIDVASVRQVLAVAQATGRLYMANFNRRVLPEFAALKAIVSGGRIGRLQRVAWTSTNWLRTQEYFSSSPWRGTWAGEGGGLLLNQCPHMLDLWQWICGMPLSILAHVALGKYHDIEVEDEVTALATYALGATAVFTASTGEYPGSQRVEIVGDRGRAILENDQLTCDELDVDLPSFIATSTTDFSIPRSTRTVHRFDAKPDYALSILRNFIDVIRGDAVAVVSGEEAVCSLQLANAMVLSHWIDRPVDLPFDESLYRSLLDQRISASRVRDVREAKVLDMRQSLRI